MSSARIGFPPLTTSYCSREARHVCGLRDRYPQCLADRWLESFIVRTRAVSNRLRTSNFRSRLIENVLGKRFRFWQSCGGHRISPLAAQYFCHRTVPSRAFYSVREYLLSLSLSTPFESTKREKEKDLRRTPSRDNSIFRNAMLNV